MNFNLALVQQIYVMTLNSLPMEKRVLEVMKESIKDVESSELLFSKLLNSLNSFSSSDKVNDLNELNDLNESSNQSEKDTQKSKEFKLLNVKNIELGIFHAKKVKIDLGRRIHETETLGRLHKEKMLDIKEARLAQERQKQEALKALQEQEALKEAEIERKRKELIAKMQLENEKAKTFDDSYSKKKTKSKDVSMEEEEEEDYEKI